MDLARTCKGMEVDALQAFASQDIGYQLNGDPNSEANRPEVGVPPEPRFQLNPPMPVVNPDKGICSKPAFRPYAEDLLQTGFYTRMRNALNTAWNTGTPRTQQAWALDLIFSRWETGRFGDANLAGTRTGVDHRMTHDYVPGASINWSDRFATRYETEARALLLPGNGGGRTMLYAGQGWVPCQLPPQVGPPCLSNATFFGQPFDTSFFVTTGALNQVVKELAAQGVLTGLWRPTYQDLGISPPPGVPPTSAAVLDGPTLAHLHPNFAALGATPASIRIRPLMAPYTYLLPDPPANWQGPVPQGRTPLTYQTAQYELTLSSSGKPG